MKKCESCGYESDDLNPEVCPECGAALTSENEGNAEQEELVVIYTCSRMYEAEMIKANLESGGVTTYIISYDISAIPSVSDEGLIQILVNESDSEAAMEYIKTIINQEDGGEVE
ncbi:MAG: DUF2007 domain-containing protein [Ignavibacteriaceae bacterium]|nr:DUF2007 domain-containing protein [Ignavibacteriaceae bacterium]